MRLELYEMLRSEPGRIFVFNNGDPQLFNPVAGAVFSVAANLEARGKLNIEDDKSHAALARRPVEIVSNLLTSFARQDTKVVGGKLHDLVISPNGSYWSSTGD